MQCPQNRKLSFLNIYGSMEGVVTKTWRKIDICKKAPYRKDIVIPMQSTHSSDLCVLLPSDMLPRIFTGLNQEEDGGHRRSLRQAVSQGPNQVEKGGEQIGHVEICSRFLFQQQAKKTTTSFLYQFSAQYSIRSSLIFRCKLGSSSIL